MPQQLNLRRAVIDAPTEIGRTIGRALIVTARYYGRALRLSLRLADAITFVQPPNAAWPVSAPEPSGAVEGVQQPPRLLLEAEAGDHASAIFLVENSRPECVSGQFSVSGFVDATGRQASPTIMFSPSEIRLEPGEQTLVQVVALIDKALEPDVRYLAEISIPGLSDSRVTIAACRRAGRAASSDNQQMAQSPADDASDPRAGEAGAKAAAAESALRDSVTK
jgi:hypothetical protein